MRLIPSAFKTKKFLFTFMTLIAVVLVIESISYLTLAMMNRNVFPLSQIYPERAARIVDAGQDTRPAGEVIHPYLGFVYNPEANSDDSLRGHANVPISEYGFLDHADPIHGKSEGRLILGIFGGSVAFWLSVHGIDSLISELTKYPAYSSKEIVVVRVALGGYKQPQQLMALNYLLVLGGEFDIIVNVDGFNEVALPPAENIPKHVAPFFPRNWYMRVQNSSDYFVSLTSGKITYLESRRSRWAALLSRAPVRYSSAFALLWKLVDTRLARQVGRCD